MPIKHESTNGLEDSNDQLIPQSELPRQSENLSKEEVEKDGISDPFSIPPSPHKGPHDSGYFSNEALEDCEDTIVMAAPVMRHPGEQIDLLAIDFGDPLTPSQKSETIQIPQLREAIISQILAIFIENYQKVTAQEGGYLISYTSSTGTNYGYVEPLEPGKPQPTLSKNYIRPVTEHELIITTQKGYVITRPVFLGTKTIARYTGDDYNEFLKIIVTNAEFKEAISRILAICLEEGIKVTLPDEWNYLKKKDTC